MIDRRALVVSYHTPQPDRDSGSRRVFHFIELLQEDAWDVAVLAADGVGPLCDARVLLQRGIAVYDGYETSIENLFREGSYDLALIAYWPNAERYLSHIRTLSPNTRIIVDSVDLHFLRESREMLRTGASSRERGLTEAHGARYAAELNSYASADGVLAVSQKEADLIGDLLWTPSSSWAVPDFEDIPPAFEPFSRRRGVVCIGSFEHPPNVEAVDHLCSDILPLIEPAILAEHPVWIVGNRLSERVRGFARGLENVQMVGWVPSVLPYLARARVSVIPLRYGAGTKRKLVQALATGTPTVSTTIGVEGLDLQNGKHVVVADDPAEFAAGVNRLLSDAKLWTRLARAGRDHVTGTNGKELAQERFREAIQAVFATAPRRTTKFPRARSQSRMTREEYERLVIHLQEMLPALVRPDSTVLVVSKGDERMAQIDGCAGGHFPQDETGRWAGYHPEDSAAAIDHLEVLRSRGAEMLVFPSTSFWWLEHYEGFAEYLETKYRLVHCDDECEVFSLEQEDVRGRPAEPRSALEGPAERDEPEPAPDETGGVQLIAFYLPQFHPIPENDAWWGQGFTEWRNVARADPQFPGHYQPHVPADLGFYDLRLAETRQRQADLARSAGIHGFCYYHYWFGSKLLLERPFDEVLSSGQPDFPFALCWANDPWSRRWDGRTDDLLQPQTYSAEDDVAHIRWLLPALRDPRAITVGEKPLFLVYRGSDLPEPAQTCDIWRREVEQAGLPGIHLVAVETAWDLGWDATQAGFDAKVLFHPQFGWLTTHVSKQGGRLGVPGADDLQVYDYDFVRAALADLDPVDYRRYESVFPGWDNTPRVGSRAVVIHNSTPSGYEEWLGEAVARARLQPNDHRIVFLNAWNEWAEGCHLEPDLRHGHAYLEATRRALQLPAEQMTEPPEAASQKRQSARRTRVPV